MKIVLVGAGNVATSLGHALFNAGHDIMQVYSRTVESAAALACVVGGSPVTELAKISALADIYIMSVKDSVIANLVPDLCKGRESKVFLHTAGSVHIDVFKNKAIHYGVLYPMQSFSKAKVLDFKNIPCFIEGNDDTAFNAVSKLGHSISDKVYPMKSDVRKQLHLAAVFACNFVNHCYEISSEILARNGLPFDIMLPLIDETVAKVHQMSPQKAQTGPAVRYDKNIIKMQLDMLKDNSMLRQIYENMSMSINNTAKSEQ